jgi:rubrerythrin
MNIPSIPPLTFEGAVKQYESIADASSNEMVKTMVQKIADEEKVHVGELQKILTYCKENI